MSRTATRNCGRLARRLALAIAMTATFAAPGAAAADAPPQITSVALQGGWLRGLQTVNVRAQDDVGVTRVEVWLDGVRRDLKDNPSPGPVLEGALLINAANMADGQHLLEVFAYDTGGQISALVDGTSRRRIATDNTSPAAPVGLAGGGVWRSTNLFTVRWTNPFEAFAPIAGAAWALCPAANGPGDDRGCQYDFRGDQYGITQLTDLKVPGPGAWRLWLWLIDSAFNHDPRHGAPLAHLGFDPEAPDVAILDPEPQDPARIRVRARDSTSSISRGEIEIRRRGARIWQSLPTELDARGLVAFVDDGELSDGVYDIRARAVDEAGNERSTDRRENGQLATITLPARTRSRLTVGKVRRVRDGRRHRRMLVVRPQAQFGRPVRLHGRLTLPGAKPVADAEIEVSEQVKLASAPWRRIGSVTTSRTGRFMFKARRGPSRVLRFRYVGTNTIRSRTAEVELSVRAATSFRVNRRHVVNGEEVTFRGQLKGRPLPPTSKLVQMQVYARRRWSTFAIVRANPKSGLWSHRYRFEATRGRVRYRFRARVPRESGYPYTTGTSQQARVMVRGL